MWLRLLAVTNCWERFDEVENFAEQVSIFDLTIKRMVFSKPIRLNE